jgi:hypothetical protein
MLAFDRRFTLYLDELIERTFSDNVPIREHALAIAMAHRRITLLSRRDELNRLRNKQKTRKGGE